MAHRNSTLSLSDRFWSKVDRNGPIPSHCPELGPCWMWTGCTRKDGYGSFTLRSYKSMLAHRVAYLLHFGSLADDVCVLHRCDNRAGCRPDHFFTGSQTDNIHDMEAKGRGRHRCGEAASWSKLTWAMVDEIRERHARDGLSGAALSKEYGVHWSTVCRVLANKCWVRPH